VVVRQLKFHLIVDSPEYACQFVLVVKDAAVLNATCAGETAPNFCGLNGR
jgi:hypothetical protein